MLQPQISLFSVFPPRHELDVDRDRSEEHEGAEATHALAATGWENHERRFLWGKILLNESSMGSCLLDQLYGFSLFDINCVMKLKGSTVSN